MLSLYVRVLIFLYLVEYVLILVRSMLFFERMSLLDAVELVVMCSDGERTLFGEVGGGGVFFFEGVEELVASG